MIRRTFSAAAVALVLSGCASSYKPSEKVASLKSGMDAEAATRVVQAALNDPTPSHGACHSSILKLEPTRPPVEITADHIHVPAFTLGDFVKEEKGVRYYRKDFYAAKFPMTEIKKLRILTNDGMSAVPYCEGPVVQIYQGFGKPDLHIAVEPQNLDAFLAAMMTLAPQAELIEGFGF